MSEYNKCGVYQITNLITGDFYIGSSVNIAGRISQHFGTAMRKYKDINWFYKDIYTYGRENFAWSVLEHCDKEQKLERERYYYNVLKPTYNQVEPDECPFKNPIVIEKSKISCKNSEKVKASHQTESVRLKCRNTRKKDMVSCQGIYGNVSTPIFECMTDAVKWLDLDCKIPCAIGHIKQSIDRGIRAYGWYWKKVMPDEVNS